MLDVILAASNVALVGALIWTVRGWISAKDDTAGAVKQETKALTEKRHAEAQKAQAEAELEDAVDEHRIITARLRRQLADAEKDVALARDSGSSLAKVYKHDPHNPAIRAELERHAHGLSLALERLRAAEAEDGDGGDGTGAVSREETPAPAGD